MTRLQEQRHIYYDPDLEIEAYSLSGIVQKFPNHFHEYYVIGFIEGGTRRMQCGSREYEIGAGSIVLLNPRDCHSCIPVNEELFNYKAVNIGDEVMKRAAKEIMGNEFIPHFKSNVIQQTEIALSIGELYHSILSKAPVLMREEALFFLLEQVLNECAESFDEAEQKQPDKQIRELCKFMEEHFSENISLEQLLTMTSFGKSYLLRVFTKQVGVSPYRYLQSIRLERAKHFLEQGVAPAEAAVMAGFSDQSHFTNFFKEFIGLTPKQYQRIFNGGKGSIC